MVNILHPFLIRFVSDAFLTPDTLRESIETLPSGHALVALGSPSQLPTTSGMVATPGAKTADSQTLQTPRWVRSTWGEPVMMMMMMISSGMP